MVLMRFDPFRELDRAVDELWQQGARSPIVPMDAVRHGNQVFSHVGPGASPVATFLVTPPAYAPNASAVVHATATVGDLQREGGVSVTVSG